MDMIDIEQSDRLRYNLPYTVIPKNTNYKLMKYRLANVVEYL